MKKRYKLIGFLAFAMYFLTGATCVLVGSSLPQLVEMYGMTLEKVVLLGSAYALGRVLTVYITGRMTEKLGPIKVLAAGIILTASFLMGIPLIVNFYAGIFTVVAAFSAVSSTLGLYISSFAQSMGSSEASGAYMLTVYNVGCVIGGFIFVWVLKYIKSQTVLLINCTGAFVATAVSMIVNTTQFYFIGLFITGLFLGVLFSVIVAIATRINSKRVSVASSLVATASGIADFLTPVITGMVISKLGIGFSFKFTLIMLAVCIASAAVLKLITTEVKEEVRISQQ